MTIAVGNQPLGRDRPDNLERLGSALGSSVPLPGFSERVAAMGELEKRGRRAALPNDAWRAPDAEFAKAKKN